MRRIDVYRSSTTRNHGRVTMELLLSTSVLEGLQLVADTTHMPDSSFSDFVIGVCESLYDESKRNVIIGGYLATG